MNLGCREWTRTIFLRGADEDYTMATRSRLLERLRVVLAGRAAEEARPQSLHTKCFHPWSISLPACFSSSKRIVLHDNVSRT